MLTTSVHVIKINVLKKEILNMILHKIKNKFNI